MSKAGRSVAADHAESQFQTHGIRQRQSIDSGRWRACTTGIFARRSETALPRFRFRSDENRILQRSPESKANLSKTNCKECDIGNHQLADCPAVSLDSTRLRCCSDTRNELAGLLYYTSGEEEIEDQRPAITKSQAFCSQESDRALRLELIRLVACNPPLDSLRTGHHMFHRPCIGIAWMGVYPQWFFIGKSFAKHVIASNQNSFVT